MSHLVGKPLLKKNKIVEAKIIKLGETFGIDLPDIDASILPSVSVLTITKNRKHMFKLAVYNWKNIAYPATKIEWVIIDDSEDPSQDLDDILPPDNRIKYLKYPPINSIGEKRNLAVSKASFNYLVHMDDDDFYFPDGILGRVRILLKYKKGCVYSHTLGCHDITTGQSAVVAGYKDVPEATLMYTRDFWQKKKFGKVNTYEGYNMVMGQEKKMVKVEFWFNMISITHRGNLTSRLRSISHNPDDNFVNFYDVVFPIEFKILLDSLDERKNIKKENEEE